MQAQGATQGVMDMAQLAKDANYEQIIHQVLGFCVEAGKSILLAAVIFVVGRFLISLINKLVEQMMSRRRIDPTIQGFLRSFVNILLTILLIVTVIGALGVNTTSFAALLASAGVAVGMALSGNLQNLAGGIIVLLFKPYRVGDFIEAMGVCGTVKEIQIFHTVIVTVDNKEIYTPNGSLSSTTVTNYSACSLRRVDWKFSVEYGSNMQQVRTALMQVLQADKRIQADPEPFVALGELSASSVDIIVRAWTKNEHYWDVFFDTNEAVYRELPKAGIHFPFPQIKVHQA